MPPRHLGGGYTRAYWGLDGQGGCEKIWEGLVGVMIMVEIRRED